MADYDEVSTLLNVYEKCVAHGTLLDNVKAKVLARLKQIEAEHAPQPAGQTYQASQAGQAGGDQEPKRKSA